MSTTEPPPRWEALLGDPAVAHLVGGEAFARALVYARTGRVADVAVDPDTMLVTGRVHGTHRDDYQVQVRILPPRPGGSARLSGRCSCPVATDCKHVAAVLVVARSTATLQQAARPAWEVTLERLLAAPAPPPAEQAPPLGLELEVETVPAHRGYGGRRDLRIRPVKQGRGGWVRSGISWEDLDFVARSFRPAHRELLLQFRAAAGAGARYALPRTPWLSLGTVTAAVWSLFEQAGEVGLALMTAAPLRGPFRAVEEATVTLDVRRHGRDGLLVAPLVELAGEPLALDTVGVLGDPAHGVFSVQTSPDGQQRLALARLSTLLGRELRQLVLDGAPLPVPTADVPRFLDEFAAPLRRQVGLTSADGSVPLPEPVPPVLALQVVFLPEQRVQTVWSVRYPDPDGGAGRRFGLARAAHLELRRDAEAEAALVAALPAVLRPPERASGSLLADADAARLVSERLPQLEALGVEVTLQGEVVNYRHSTAAPQVQVDARPAPAGGDWFDLQVEVSLEGEPVPFEELFVALSLGEEQLVLQSGLWFSLDRPELATLRGLIEESRALGGDDHDLPAPTSGVLRLDPGQADLWQELVDAGVTLRSGRRWAAAVEARLTAGQGPPPAPPPGLAATLRSYQHEGFGWLVDLWSHGLGGVLADDMGLGKTLQTLALVLHARAARPDAPPFLVVAPTSVVSGWVREAAAFAPGLRVLTLDRTMAARQRTGRADESSVDSSSGAPPPGLAALVAGADLVVTSYAVLRIDADHFAEAGWSGLVLDEAQFVKNRRSKTYLAARRVSAPFVLAVTGTPLENDLMDLWALLSLTAPGLFPDPDRFATWYRRPIERGEQPERLQRLRRRIRPLVLRRTKENVAPELPAKQEQVRDVVLAPRHLRLYQTYLQRERQQVLGLLDDVPTHRFTILGALTRLRRLCLDPALVDPALAHVGSAKTDLLLDDLRQLVAEGHRALVFSQFTGFLGRVRARLEEVGLEYAYLDGATRDRDAAVERFRSGAAPVFLVSLKAGGFGLNLTEADYCYLLDPWWNPAAEAQAVDRAHRIGQDKTVMVYRLVARDTVEEKVMALKARKGELADAVLEADGLASTELSADDIRGLLAG